MATQDKIYIYGDSRVVRPSVRVRLLDAFGCFVRHPVGCLLGAIALGAIGGLVGAVIALSGR